MMRTTHTIVHRLKTIFNRFKDKPEHVYVVMQEIKDDQDLSVDVEPTVNPDRTDSEKSDEEPEQVDNMPLGLHNKPSEFGDLEDEEKVEEKDEKPWEQATENKQEEAQILLQVFVDAQI